MTDTSSAAAALPGTLYVVATPLGNLGDLSARARAVLAGVDLVAAEDTRHTLRLLDHLGLHKKLMAVHEHNERESAARLVDRLRDGASVALVSDAGTPAVSDPGARVVRVVQDAGLPVVPVPGPSAVITALSAAGLLDARFLFVGFLPVKSGARRTELEKLKALPATLVFYEAPHRIEETVADLLGVLGPQRELVLARELTKLFESIVRMPLGDGPAWLAGDEHRRKGEFVVLVSGAAESGAHLTPEAERALGALMQAVSVRQAVQLAAEITGVSRKLLYERALQLKQQGGSEP